MNFLNLIILSVLVMFNQHVGPTTTQQEVNENLKNLPFPAFTIQVPVFPDKQYLITKFGAVGDATTNCTKAINEAIATCSENGGGTVIVPPGMYMTGQIEMKSNVNLHLDAGAMVIFNPDVQSYPLVKHGSGYYIKPLINGYKLKNVAITGRGSFDGNGQYWRPVKREKMTPGQWKNLVKSGGEVSPNGKMWYPNKQAAEGKAYLSSKKKSELTKADYEKVKTFLRPKMLSLDHCDNVLVEGVTLKNPPNFNMIMRFVDGLIVRDVKVMNDWWIQNGDGLDISSCRNVLMYDCIVNSGDDGICIKSSPTNSREYAVENVVIKDCSVFHAHGGFVVGSNTNGNVRNIYVSNCSYTGTETGLRFKSNVGRGGKVTNIFIDNVFMKDIEKDAVIFNLKYSDKAAVKNKGMVREAKYVPDFSGIHINHVVCDGAKEAFLVNGSVIPMVSHVTISNSIFRTEKGIASTLSHDITFDNCTFTVKKKPAVKLQQTRQWKFENCSFNQPKGTMVELSGAENQDIEFNHTLVQADWIRYLNGATKKAISITR